MPKHYILEINRDYSTELRSFSNYSDGWNAFEDARYSAQNVYPVRLIRAVKSKLVVVARNSKASDVIKEDK